MPEFVKPTRKVVKIEDTFGELIGKTLVKDLHDNEEICPICHGTGLRSAASRKKAAKKKNGSKKQKSTSRMRSGRCL